MSNQISRSTGIIFILPDGVANEIVQEVRQQYPEQEGAGIFHDPTEAYRIMSGIEANQFVIITVLDGWEQGRATAFKLPDMLKMQRFSKGAPRVIFADRNPSEGDRLLLAAGGYEYLER